MKFFRDLPKPPAWPPPRSSHELWTALDYVRRHDPIGDLVHRGFGVAYCAMLPFSTSLSSVFFGILVFYAMLRLPHTWRCYPALLRLAPLWAITAFVAWQALSLAWSRETAQGLDELRALRVLATPLLLWPVIPHATWFVGAALCGVLGVHVVQALQLAGVIEPYSQEARLSALMHPIQTGAWCTAALCWNLAGAGRARGWMRGLFALGALLAGLGLLGTESRGPWISAAVAVPACLVWIAWQRPRARKVMAQLAIVGMLCGVVVGLAAGASLRARVGTGWQQIAAASEEGAYWESAGLRVGLATWSIDVWRNSPVVGWGAGGFQRAVDALPSFQQVRQEAYVSLLRGLEDYPLAQDGEIALPEAGGYRGAIRKGLVREDFLRPDHAHAAFLHTFVTSGALGVGVLVVMLGLGLRQAWHAPRAFFFRDGTPFVIISWLIGAMFDSYHLDGHRLGLFALAVAISLPRGMRDPAVETEPLHE